MCIGWYQVCRDFVVEGHAFESPVPGRASRPGEVLRHHGQVCDEGDDVDAVALRLDNKIDEYCRKSIQLIDGRRFQCRRNDPVVEKSPVQVTTLKGFWDIVLEFLNGLFR